MANHRIISILVSSMLLCTARSASGDAVVKIDGTRLEGIISRDPEGWAVIAKDGTRTVVPVGEVKSVDLGGKPDVAAEAGLASLRRAIEAQSDPRKAIDRYKQFITSYRGTNASAEAQLDLAVWQERVDRRLVRVSGKWITPEEAAALKASATDQAKAAIEDLRQSKINDATDLLALALAADPANPTALYVRAVVYYRQDKFPDAKRTFEASLAAAPIYGPTLNNIAVTAFRMGQVPLALSYYDQALVAMPLERGLLNNVAEAWEALPEVQRNTPLAKRVKRKFDEQDTLLAQRLAQQGLFRWGASWVTQKELDDLKAAEEKGRKLLDKLAGEYQALADSLIRVEAQINANQRDMGTMEAQTLRVDAAGHVVQFPLPPAYASLKAQTDGLIATRQVTLRQQAAIRDQARAAQKTSVGVRFTGVQQIYAAEAAPIPAPPRSATTVP